MNMGKTSPRTRRAALIVAACLGAARVGATVMTGGDWAVYASRLVGVSGEVSGGGVTVRHQVAHSYGIDGTAMSGGAFTLDSVLSPAPLPQPRPQRPLLEVEPGDVKVLGGRRGYADLRAAEPVDVLFNPRESGAVTVRIFTVRGRLVREQTVPCTQGVQTGFSWNGENADGGRVAAGVYLVRVTGAGLNVTKRIAVVQ